jgi:GMP synthase (glutamine-hydrolysing)
MKPFLIMQLRPETVTADSEYAAILQYGDLSPYEVRRLRIEQTGIPSEVDPRLYSGIIVGGSPFDISTPAKDKSHIQQKIEADFQRFLATIVTEDIPFLGACSGNGLLGKYCGATISRQFGEPIGGIDVTKTAAGTVEPLLLGLPDTFRVLVGHKEACDDVPPGATLLLSGTECRVQMFRLGEHVYATQFHPEGDAKGFCLRINTYKHNGYFDPADAEILKERVRDEHTPHAQAILRNFVARYREE